MAYVIASTCIDVKDGACQEACPVECIYEGGQISNLTSASIAGSACRSVRSMRFTLARICRKARAFELANAEFFGPAITGWGSPGGADSAHVSAIDYRLVAIRAK